MSKNHFVSHFLPFQINTSFYFCEVFFTKWLPSAILDVRNSLWITFLAILDQYRFFFFFFYKMAAGGHFGCPKITFDLISGHFRSIHNFNFFLKFLTKWLPSAILDVRNSLWITFLAILDHYRIFFFEIFDKMADVAHFGCPKFTFDRISGHFRSICNFIFFWKFLTKWLPAAILDVRNSLLIAFLAISDRSAILDFRNSLSMAFLAISYPYGTLFIF